MSIIPSFLAELKRRKVIRVAGVYVVSGWAILQGAERLFPVLQLPGWTITFVAALLLIGLPITMIVTWAFELTPDGVRRTAAGDLEPPPAGGTWIELALLVAILAAVGVSVAQFVGDDPIAPATQPAARTPEPAAPSTSVAVLPFTSFSDDADSNYFADGLTEELINSLAQIPGLKVSGRTSAYYFKNRNEDLREIGRKLGVAHVLEGSVRQAGDRLRITAQLITTSDGFHLWSQTYDRRMDDILAIQDDVAGNVATALETRLIPRDPTLSGTGHDSKGYQDYLVATALLRDGGRDPLTQARSLLSRVIERDPDNVDALASYAEATMQLAAAYLTIDFESATTDALGAVERALALNPGSVAANAASGAVHMALAHRTGERRYLTLAERALSRAVDLAPSNADVLTSYGELLNQMGRFPAALELLQRAALSDPLSLATRFQLSAALQGLGRLGEAREELEAMVAAHPDLVGIRLELGELLMRQGRFDEAVPLVRSEHAARVSPRASFALANIYLNLGLQDAVRQTLAEMDYAPLTEPLRRVALLNMQGEDEAALALANAEFAVTHDRLWWSQIIASALLIGDLETAREHLMQLEPLALEPAPDLQRIPAEAALQAALLLMGEGNTADATNLLERVLEAHAPPAAGYDPPEHKVLRAQVLAQLGRAEAALAELHAAKLQGFRMLWDFDYFHRLDRHPMFAGLRDTAEFQALIGEIEAENRAMGERLAETPKPLAEHGSPP